MTDCTTLNSHLVFAPTGLSTPPTPNLSQGGTWGPLPRCPKGCWVKKKDEHQLLPIAFHYTGASWRSGPYSSHLPPFPGAPGGFLEAELTHLNLHTWPSTLQTAQALLLLLALTWGSREGGWAAVRVAGHRGGFIPRTTETREGI